MGSSLTAAGSAEVVVAVIAHDASARRRRSSRLARVVGEFGPPPMGPECGGVDACGE
jgi:hypothetical protein